MTSNERSNKNQPAVKEHAPARLRSLEEIKAHAEELPAIMASFERAMPQLRGTSKALVDVAAYFRLQALMAVMSVARELEAEGMKEEQVYSLVRAVMFGPDAGEAAYWLAQARAWAMSLDPALYWRQVLLNYSRAQPTTSEV